MTHEAASAYDELVAAIVKVVPEITKHKSRWSRDEESCRYCSTLREYWDDGTPETVCCGRPITLEDVLRALQNRDIPVIGVDINGHFIDCDENLNNIVIHDQNWILGHDLAWHRDNAPETIRFLHSLLCV